MNEAATQALKPKSVRTWNGTAVIRAAIPDADDDLCDFILWNRTPFPFKLSPRILYYAAHTWRRAAINNIDLCDWCNNRAEPGKYLCESHQRAIASSTSTGSGEMSNAMHYDRTSRRMTRCHADSDGDCDWPDCPQLKNYQSHCPLDIGENIREATFEEQYDGLRGISPVQEE